MSLCEKKKTSQLQATGNNFVLGYGPGGRDCVCSMGHCAEFGSLLLELKMGNGLKVASYFYK
jgi:hypothetical protein